MRDNAASCLLSANEEPVNRLISAIRHLSFFQQNPNPFIKSLQGKLFFNLQFKPLKVLFNL